MITIVTNCMINMIRINIILIIVVISVIIYYCSASRKSSQNVYLVLLAKK